MQRRPGLILHLSPSSDHTGGDMRKHQAISRVIQVLAWTGTFIESPLGLATVQVSVPERYRRPLLAKTSVWTVLR